MVDPGEAAWEPPSPRMDSAWFVACGSTGRACSHTPSPSVPPYLVMHALSRAALVVLVDIWFPSLAGPRGSWPGGRSTAEGEREGLSCPRGVGVSDGCHGHCTHPRTRARMSEVVIASRTR